MYLEEDQQTLCWQGPHLAAGVGAVLLVIFYTLGFPLFCFVLLTRAFTDHATGGFIGWLRAHFSFLRGTQSRPRRTLSMMNLHEAEMVQTRPASPSLRDSPPMSPSHGDWMEQQPTAAPAAAASRYQLGTESNIRVHPAPAHPHPHALSLSTKQDAIYAAQVQRRRENEYGFLFLGKKPNHSIQRDNR